MYSITLFGCLWPFLEILSTKKKFVFSLPLQSTECLDTSSLCSPDIILNSYTCSLHFSLICFVCFRITMYYLLGLPENAFFYFVVFHFILLSLNLGFIFVIFMYLAFNFIKHRGDKRALEWRNLAIWRENLPWLILKRTCSRNKFTFPVLNSKCFV